MPIRPKSGLDSTLLVAALALSWVMVCAQAPSYAQEQNVPPLPGKTPGQREDPIYLVRATKINVQVKRGEKTPAFRVPRLKEGDEILIDARSLDKSRTGAYWAMVAFFLPQEATTQLQKTDFHVAAFWNCGKDCPVYMPLIVPDSSSTPVVIFFQCRRANWKAAVAAVEEFANAQSSRLVEMAEVAVPAAEKRSRIDQFLMALKSAKPAYVNSNRERILEVARGLGIDVDEKDYDKADKKWVYISQKVLDGCSVRLPTDDELAGELGQLLPPGTSEYAKLIITIYFTAKKFLWWQPDFEYLPTVATPEGDQLVLKTAKFPLMKGDRLSAFVYVPVRPSEDDTLNLELGKADKPVCIGEMGGVIPVASAPEQWSNPASFGHDWNLTVSDSQGKVVVIEDIKPGAVPGGFVVDADASSRIRGELSDEVLRCRLDGQWGFDPISAELAEGILCVRPREWQVAPHAAESIQPGGPVTIELSCAGLSAVRKVLLKQGNITQPVSAWSVSSENGVDRLSITLDPAKSKPGPAQILVYQEGMNAPDPPVPVII